MYVTSISDESCMQDVTWGDILCGKRYLLSRQYQREASGVIDEYDKNEYVWIEGDDRNALME